MAHAFGPGGGGGRLQPVLMRPTPQLSVKTWGGGGLAVRPGGGGSQGGGACAQPTTPTCIPPGGMCVWGFGSMERCMWEHWDCTRAGEELRMQDLRNKRHLYSAPSC